MRKQIFWTCVASTLVGVLNLVLYAILLSCKVIPGRELGWLMGLGFIGAAWVPMVINLIAKTKFNMWVLVTYEVFIFFSICFCSQWSGYGMIRHLDKFVHAFSGLLFALIAYNLLKESKNTKASWVWVFLIVFSFSMMCGGVWEIYEFTADGLVGGNAQGSLGLVGHAALWDTMLDLVADLSGAVLGGLICVWLEFKEKKQLSQNANTQTTAETENSTQVGEKNVVKAEKKVKVENSRKLENTKSVTKAQKNSKK